jgi:hypothetical protein
MSAFALPMTLFAAGLGWLLVAIIRGSFDDPYPLKAGVTWAVTLPAAGLLLGVGLAPLALVLGTVSMLALGSLGYWFLATEPDDTDDSTDEPVEPDPGPSDDEVIEIPAWALRAPEREAKPKSDVDWDAFDKLRKVWERTKPRPRPRPVTEPETQPAPEHTPAGP